MAKFWVNVCTMSMINSLSIMVYRVWRAPGPSPARRQPHGNNLEGGERINTVEGGQQPFCKDSIRVPQKITSSLCQISADIRPMRYSRRTPTRSRGDTWSAEYGDSSVALNMLFPASLLTPESNTIAAPCMLALDEPMSFLKSVQ